MEKLASKITKVLVRNNMIKFDDYEVCIYGMQLIVITSIDIIGLLFIGFCFNWFIETAVFILFFYFLRISAGGYHASTALRCFILVSILTHGSIFLIKNLNIFNSEVIIIALLIVSFLLILRYAPVDSENKPLNSDEKKRYKRKSIITFSLQIAIITIAYISNRNMVNYCSVAAVSSFIESVTLMTP